MKTKTEWNQRRETGNLDQNGIWGSHILPESLPDRTGGRQDCLYILSGSGDADGKDRADLYKS